MCKKNTLHKVDHRDLTLDEIIITKNFPRKKNRSPFDRFPIRSYPDSTPRLIALQKESKLDFNNSAIDRHHCY